MNVTYYTGELAAKRRLIREKAAEATVADNDDILGYFRLSGKLYCLPGTLPFADMSVRAFIAYKRSLINENRRPMTDREIKCYLRAVGLKIRLSRKVGTLSRIEYRHLCLAAGFNASSHAMYINFDGLSYSRANKKALGKLLCSLPKDCAAYVAVSDSRFIPRGGSVQKVTADGVELTAPVRQRSRTVSKRVLGKYFRSSPVSFGLDYSLLCRPVLIV